MPSLSASPRNVIVSDDVSDMGTSTQTPVSARISLRLQPLCPIMYLCCDFFTSTETVLLLRSFASKQNWRKLIVNDTRFENQLDQTNLYRK